MIGDGDVEAIFENGDFDTEASFATTPTATVINGWFTDGTDAVVVYGVELEAQNPSFTTPTANLTAAMKAHGLSVTINTVVYKLQKVQSLGPVGVSIVYLKTT